MKAWYEKLFANYAAPYDKEVFTQGTLGEVISWSGRSTMTDRSGFWISGVGRGATRSNWPGAAIP